MKKDIVFRPRDYDADTLVEGIGKILEMGPTFNPYRPDHGGRPLCMEVAEEGAHVPRRGRVDGSGRRKIREGYPGAQVARLPGVTPSAVLRAANP